MPAPQPESRTPAVSPPQQPDDLAMASNNALESFLGGSPLNVFARLLFVSLVVGALLMWLEIHPLDILRGLQRFLERIYDLGFGAIRELVNYVLAGAAIVVPVWFILRVLSVGGRRP
jgi:hypothetical protein